MAANLLGLLPLIVLLKMPIARRLFVQELRCRSSLRDKEGIVFDSLRRTAVLLQSPQFESRFRKEIDDVKGPLKSDGTIEKSEVRQLRTTLG